MNTQKKVSTSQSEYSAFHDHIFSWWSSSMRDLPWRKTRDPYKIHIAELMLQQTQVSRVLPKYTEFLELFPTVYSLASAPLADVIRVWKGLGYNRRCLYLHKAAKEIVTGYQGIYPKTEQELRKLPGLGIYTARAILVFAYEQQIPFIDTNIRKIFIRFFPHLQDCTEKELLAFAAVVLPKNKAWEWHQALMDYGSAHAFRVAVKKTNTTPKIKFEQTNRFIRGRIIDAVRDQTMKETELIECIHSRHDKSHERISYNLNALVEEGLLAKNGESISLPV